MIGIDLQEYELVWEDDFAYEGVPNPAKWNYDLGNHQWANQELQAYTDRPGNVIVRDGKLVIRALKEQNGEHEYRRADDTEDQTENSCDKEGQKRDIIMEVLMRNGI